MEALLMIVVDASIFSWILLLLSCFMDFCLPAYLGETYRLRGLFVFWEVDGEEIGRAHV